MAPRWGPGNRQKSVENGSDFAVFPKGSRVLRKPPVWTIFVLPRAIAKSDSPIERQSEHRARLRRASCEYSRETERVEPSELVELGTIRRSRVPSKTGLSVLGCRDTPKLVALNSQTTRRVVLMVRMARKRCSPVGTRGSMKNHQKRVRFCRLSQG